MSEDEAGGRVGEAAPWDRASLPSPVIPLENTFEGFLDLEWLSLSEDSAHVRFHVRENLKQPLGLMHGGIYAAVAETIASVATVNNVWRDGFVGSGLSNYASFGRVLERWTMSSPKRPFAQANQGRVKCAESSLSNDSWMKPVPASVTVNSLRQVRMTAGSVALIARQISDIGQIWPSPMCGPPMPLPALPSKK